MSKLAEKLRLPRVQRITRTTARSLSITLATLSLSAFRLLRSLLLRTFALLPPMDDAFFSSSDDTSFNDSNNLLDLDCLPSSSTQYSSGSNLFFNRAGRLSDDGDDEDTDVEKLYLVPYGWWSTAKTVYDLPGVLYDILYYNKDANGDEDLVLNLRKGCREAYDTEESFSEQAYALMSESMWLRALRWRNASQVSTTEIDGHLSDGDHIREMFRLKIRLYVSSEQTDQLVVKIKLKENAIAFFKRASNILGPTAGLRCIWDFSGQTSQFLVDERMSIEDCSVECLPEEVLLDLFFYGFSNASGGIVCNVTRHYKVESVINSDSVNMNGTSDYQPGLSRMIDPWQPSYGSTLSFLGVTGLQNLGNTCFMNSAVQCLAHSSELVDYFLGDYKKELNRENPLGMKGELALAFGELLRKLWFPGSAPVAPVNFKKKLSDFSHQFSGYNQHDSQEFLAFLLDGLHEDLNRVIHKPYIEAKDAEGCPDEEVAEEYWQNHLARNDSIVVDLFQGQYRSTLLCPSCKKKSVTFDPFMYLSLPLPSTTMRTMTITVVDAYGMYLPSPVTVTVLKNGSLKDLVDALSIACSLRDDEVLLVAEIYRNRIVRFLEDSFDALGLIRDADKLVAYRLPKDGTSRLVVFMHERLEKPYEFERLTTSRKLFGIPLIASIPVPLDGLHLESQFLRILSPFSMQCHDTVDDGIYAGSIDRKEALVRVASGNSLFDTDNEAGCSHDAGSNFQFHLLNGLEIKMEDPLQLPSSSSSLDIYVFWSDEMIEKYDTCLLSSLPEVCKPRALTRIASESVSLYKCLQAFLKEEPLGPENMWYCPCCKSHRQAIKKLDLWRLPEILVVHLKRFSYSKFTKNKLEAYVEFPIEDFDLSTYVAFQGHEQHRYLLYAISNHYGGMGGGHYTAFVDLGSSKWFEFDDERVFPVSEDKIKSVAAYVLFYRRIT